MLRQGGMPGLPKKYNSSKRKGKNSSFGGCTAELSGIWIEKINNISPNQASEINLNFKIFEEFLLQTRTQKNPPP